MYRIYGKVIQEYWYKNIHHLPQKMFRALDKYGVQVTRLNNAYCYDTKEEAQAVINRANNNLKKNGHENCVLFEIRKA